MLVYVNSFGKIGMQLQRDMFQLGGRIKFERRNRKMSGENEVHFGKRVKFSTREEGQDW